MASLYLQLTYEEYKELEEQLRELKETSHKSEGGFYHKSIRLKITENTTLEFHGPLVKATTEQEVPSIPSIPWTEECPSYDHKHHHVTGDR